VRKLEKRDKNEKIESFYLIFSPVSRRVNNYIEKFLFDHKSSYFGEILELDFNG
jgi:hypothetical protein